MRYVVNTGCQYDSCRMTFRPRVQSISSPAIGSNPECLKRFPMICGTVSGFWTIARKNLRQSSLMPELCNQHLRVVAVRATMVGNVRGYFMNLHTTRSLRRPRQGADVMAARCVKTLRNCRDIVEFADLGLGLDCQFVGRQRQAHPHTQLPSKAFAR